MFSLSICFHNAQVLERLAIDFVLDIPGQCLANSITCYINVWLVNILGSVATSALWHILQSFFFFLYFTVLKNVLKNSAFRLYKNWPQAGFSLIYWPHKPIKSSVVTWQEVHSRIMAMRMKSRFTCILRRAQSPCILSHWRKRISVNKIEGWDFMFAGYVEGREHASWEDHRIFKVIFHCVPSSACWLKLVS